VRVFATGATGFIGTRVVEALVLEEHEVWGLTRNPEGVQRLRHLGADGVVGDLRDGSEHLAGVVRRLAPEVVLHLAAESATQRNPKRIWEVDVEGTRRLLAACAAAPPAHFVYAGTVVVGDPGGAVLREDAPLVATTAYGRAKVEAERLCFEEGRRMGAAVTSIRPSHVYGPGGWFADIVRDLARGRFFVPGRGDNLWDLVHVDDVARAFAAAVAAREAGAGQVFHVVDDEPTTLRAFIDAAADALRVARPRSVPVWLARLVAGRGPVAAAVRSARSSSEKISRVLGWRPRYPSARAALPAVVSQIMGHSEPAAIA
jgi:nucleoside-diphosphate-sugar epimerase